MRSKKKKFFYVGLIVLTLLYSTTCFAQEQREEEINDTGIEMLSGNAIDPRVNIWTYIQTTTGNVGVPAGTYVPGTSSYYVKLLQAALNTLNHSCGTVDGIYGNNTRNAVMSFQRECGLTVDGIVGQSTWVMVTKYTDKKNIKVPFQK